MFQIGMAKQLVEVLENVPFIAAIGTRERVEGRDISRCCLRLQRIDETGMIDFDQHRKVGRALGLLSTMRARARY